MKPSNKLSLLILVCLYSMALQAQPDLTVPIQEHNLTFFRDYEHQNIFYYMPGDLVMGKKNDGTPDFNFIMMRYAGSALYNSDHQQSFQYRNLLTMKINMIPPDPDSLAAAKKSLSVLENQITIKPLPLTNLQAMIVFAPAGQGLQSDSLLIEKGEMATENTNGYSTDGSFWEERYFTVFLDNYTAQLLNDAFEKKLTAVSFTYAFYSKGITDKKVFDQNGYGDLYEQVKKQFKSILSDSSTASGPHECIVKSNAWPVLLNLEQYPQLIKKIDINETVPAGYTFLNIRNYDFSNDLRPELYEKTVDIQAKGAGGNMVNLSVTFHQKNRDVTSYNFHFPYAIRPDEPYSYRVRELLRDGREIISEWKTVRSWTNILDVTSHP